MTHFLLYAFIFLVVVILSLRFYVQKKIIEGVGGGRGGRGGGIGRGSRGGGIGHGGRGWGNRGYYGGWGGYYGGRYLDVNPIYIYDDDYYEYPYPYWYKYIPFLNYY